MKQSIQQLIEQHRLHISECNEELDSIAGVAIYESVFMELEKEIEMRTLFISELQELLTF